MNAPTNRMEIAKGLPISPVIIGLWQVADLERNGKTLDPQVAAKALYKYYQGGLTTFDMADHYGSAEVIAGVFDKSYAKGSAQLFTKWVPSPGVLTKKQVKEAIAKSLTRLQTDCIDLLQFHAWNYADPIWLDSLYWLQELKTEGYIKHLGVTNFDTAHLLMAIKSGIQLVTNQVCYSLLDQRASEQMATVCLANNVRLLAFGTIAGGFLSERWLNKPEPVLNEKLTWSQMKYKRFIDVSGGWSTFQGLLQTLHSIAVENNTTIATLASKFILDQPAVVGVIIGARLGESEHSEENKKLLSFQLDDFTKNKILQAIGKLNKIPGDCGDEYRKPPFLTATGDLSHHINSLPPPFPSIVGIDGRTKALSGTIWEDLAGFSRAVKKGNRILVSGTTATHGKRLIGGDDPHSQMHFVIDKIEGALLSLGATLQDVVRTRIYIKNISDWEVVARVHGERFKDIQPANTMIKAELIGEDYLVEMEAEAIIEK
jgi:aryl-alcohol dehydrogenase-like predicted oxidoreductase/enamine deaminase RidA (YjgF/YER057c/UK114 family)